MDFSEAVSADWGPELGGGEPSEMLAAMGHWADVGSAENATDDDNPVMDAAVETVISATGMVPGLDSIVGGVMTAGHGMAFVDAVIENDGARAEDAFLDFTSTGLGLIPGFGEGYAAFQTGFNTVMTGARIGGMSAEEAPTFSGLTHEVSELHIDDPLFDSNDLDIDAMKERALEMGKSPEEIEAMEKYAKKRARALRKSMGI